MNFKPFNIDNYEELFIENGFNKTEEQYQYECDYCNDLHFASVFEKDGKKYYFNYEYADVIEI